MITYPKSKINLGLHIRRKREDGYHEIDSVFYPVSWCDALEVERNMDGIESSFSGLTIDGDSSNNLIEKVFHLIKRDYSQLTGMKYHLTKKIPMGAGLGGGSSDAAHAINLLNEIYELNLSFEKKMEYAAALGSDINFFLFDQACRCTGRGEKVQRINLSLKGYWVVLLNPGIHVGTSEAYSNVYKDDREIDITRLLSSQPHQWKDFLANDFEKSVFNHYPEIEEIKDRMYSEGADYASMSGSGSTVYGLFKVKPELDWEGVWIGELE